MENRRAMPPDFSQWRLDRALSLYCRDWNRDYVVDNPSPNDLKDIFWFAFKNDYTDPTGLADGCEYNFFNRGVIVKRWGLKTSDQFEAMAVLYDGRWRTFSDSHHCLAVNLAAVPSRFAIEGLKVVSVEVADRVTTKAVLSIRVER